MNKTKISYIRGLIYIFGITCFLQAQELKINLLGTTIAFNRIIILVFLCMFVYDILIRKEQIVLGEKDVYHSFLLVWLGWQLVNFGFGLANGFTGWLKLSWVILIFIACYYVLKKNITTLEFFNRTLICVHIGMMIQMIIGIYEHITGIYHWTSYKELFMNAVYFKTKKYPCAMQTNPNDYATLMFFLLFISLVMLKIYRMTILKIMSLATAALSLYLIVVSDSRIVMIGVIISFLYVVYDKLIMKHRLNARVCAMSIIILIVGIIAFCLYDGLQIVLELGDKLHISMRGNSEATRANIYLSGLKEVIKTFGIGCGVHNQAWHSLIVEVLAESGIVILFLLLRCYVWLVKKIKKVSIKCENSKYKYVTNCFYAMLIGYPLVSFAPASSLNIEWLGLMFGLMFLYGNLAEKQFVRKEGICEV